jgi:hypothetical protein
MNILTNNICELQILSKAHLIFEDDNTSKNVNLLSGVFFKRPGYYKNFGVYVSGLARTVKFIDEYNREVDKLLSVPEAERSHTSEKFYFLLFIDHNVRDDDGIMRIINSSKNVIPVLFSCPGYMEDKYHVDLFGTLVRFFPMFTFENNPAKTVISIDIELNREDRRKVYGLMKHIPPGVTASGEIHKLIYNGEVPYIYSGTLCYNREKFDSELITKFIESAHTIVGTGHYGKRKTTFGYGIDEMFLNSHLIPAVKNYSIIIEYQISYFLYYSQTYITKQKRSDITHEMLKMILYDLYSSNLTTTDMLAIIKQSQYIYDIKNMIRRQTRQNKGIGAWSESGTAGESDEEESVIDTNVTSTDLEVEYTDTDVVDSSDDQNSTMHKILHKLLGDLYVPSKSVNELLSLVDQKTYNIREKNEVNNALAERFYYIINDLLQNNKTWMETDVMKLIDDNLRNVISAIVVFKIDPDNKEVTDITTYDTVYTDNIIE